MRRNFLLTIVAIMTSVCCMAQVNPRVLTTGDGVGRFLTTLPSIDQRQLVGGCTLNHKSVDKIRRRADAADDSIQFIFNPQGEEKMYCMSSYSYDQTNQKFVRATSLKSQVRYDADGKTVYFKDLTTSLGAATWVSGTIDGDTIRIPGGQPLAYYRSKYLVFFCPMIYNDSTGVMEAQDELKLVVKGDSLAAPTYEDGVFQCAAGYVYVSSTTQGALSYDLDHNMSLVTTKPVVVPSGVAPVEYVYTYMNSSDKETKSKVNVITDGDDIYMQLSTSAPNAYVYGKVSDNKITVPGGQFITDSTFIYYYSLAVPVYNDSTGEIEDFLPAPNRQYLRIDPETHSITATRSDLFGVDYMDGMEMCMDYVMNPRLDVYAGDCPARPAAPEWKSLNLGDVYMPYVSFNISNLDVDGNYINSQHITYNLLFDIDPETFSKEEEDPRDYVYEFTHDNYQNISETITDIPYDFKDNYDFFIYGSLHYVYIYEKLFSTIGVQTIYTVDGVENRSDIIVYDQDTGTASVIDTAPVQTPDDPEDGVTSVATTRRTAEVYNMQGQRVNNTNRRGIYIINGQKVAK